MIFEVVAILWYSQCCRMGCWKNEGMKSERYGRQGSHSYRYSPHCSLSSIASLPLTTLPQMKSLVMSEHRKSLYGGELGSCIRRKH